MGGKHSDLVYSVPVSTEVKKGETQVRRHPKSKDQLINYPSEDLRTLQAIILNSEKNFASRDCLGTRDSDKVYRFKTYRECVDISRKFGSGLLNLNLVPEVREYKNHAIRFLAVYSKNREEYIFSDIAANLYGLTTVAVYDTLGPTVITFILEQTNLVTLCATDPGVNTLLQETNLGKLKTIISFDNVTDEQRKKAESKGLTLYTFQDVVKAGETQIQPPAQVTPDTIYTFSYTSGTTGNPKGVMLSHGNIVATLNTLDYTDVRLGPEDVHLSYLPLAHIFERLMANAFLYKGGKIGFFNGDVQKLKEDMMDLKPTFFPSVPRLFNRFYDLIRANMGKLTGIKKKISEKAISSKAYYLKNGCHYTHRVYDKLVCNKVKEIFGGRVKYMLTASAPISSEVIDYLKIVCCCPIIEGYGQTESSGGSFVTRADDPETGHVGGPTVCTEFKLVDVADMGYTSEDKDDKGQPAPRGEICLRGAANFKGYYKDDEKTREAVDEDGWLHTGDVGVLLANGSVKIIDRKKNIFKLAHGEYVAAEKIELCYQRSDAVEECFVYGDSLQAYLVGFVVPKIGFLKKAFPDVTLDFASPQVNKAVLDEMLKHGKKEKLLGFEQVKKIVVLPESFAVKGLLTTTFKLKRHEAKLYFKEQIDKMYADPN